MRNTIASNAVGELFLSNGLRKLKYFFGLMLCVFGIGSDITAAPSDLDPTFGTNGSVIFDASGTGGIYGYSIALQPDGKIVMIGNKTSSASGFAVVRFNADGSPDDDLRH